MSFYNSTVQPLRCQMCNFLSTSAQDSALRAEPGSKLIACGTLIAVDRIRVKLLHTYEKKGNFMLVSKLDFAVHFPIRERKI